MLYPTTTWPEAGSLMVPAPQLRSTECDVAVAVKLTPLTFAFVTVTDCEEGLKVYPAKLGVNTKLPGGTSTKLNAPLPFAVVLAVAVPFAAVIVAEATPALPDKV